MSAVGKGQEYDIKTARLGPMNGQDTWADGVPKIDTTEAQIETILNTARGNADVRRADGRKAPLLLLAEYVEKLRSENGKLLLEIAVHQRAARHSAEERRLWMAAVRTSEQQRDLLKAKIVEEQVRYQFWIDLAHTRWYDNQKLRADVLRLSRTPWQKIRDYVELRAAIWLS